MQDTGDQNAAWFLAVKHDVLALLHTAQPGPNLIVRTTESGIVREKPATLFHLGDITISLSFAPSTEGIKADVEQIGLGAARETKPGH